MFSLGLNSHISSNKSYYDYSNYHYRNPRLSHNSSSSYSGPGSEPGSGFYGQNNPPFKLTRILEPKSEAKLEAKSEPKLEPKSEPKLESESEIVKDINHQLRNASSLGYLEKVQHLIQQNQNQNQNYKLDFGRALYEAAEFGHLSVVQYLVNLNINKTVAHLVEHDLNDALIIATHYAYESPHDKTVPVIKYLIEVAGATDLNQALAEASANGNLNLVQYLIDRGATHINNAMAKASAKGQLQTVKYLIARGPTDFDTSINEALENGQVPVLELLVDLIGLENLNLNLDLNQALRNAIKKKQLEMVKYLVSSLSAIKNKNDLSNAISWANFYHVSHDPIVIYLEEIKLPKKSLSTKIKSIFN